MPLALLHICAVRWSCAWMAAVGRGGHRQGGGPTRSSSRTRQAPTCQVPSSGSESHPLRAPVDGCPRRAGTPVAAGAATRARPGDPEDAQRSDR